GWYLFPVDPASGVASSPLYQSPADLAKMPKACAPDADGFLLSGSPLALAPTVFFPDGTEPPVVDLSVRAQFVWSAQGLCTRALSASTETSLSLPSAAHSDDTAGRVPLTLLQRRPEGRRRGFTCAP